MQRPCPNLLIDLNYDTLGMCAWMTNGNNNNFL